MQSHRLEKLSGDRRLVWDLLSDTGSYYLNHQVVLVDFSAVENARRELNGTGSERRSYTAFAMYAISRALPDFPVFNSYLREWPTAKLALYNGVDICFTVERAAKAGRKYVGLSIIKNADRMTFDGIRSALAEAGGPEYEKSRSFKNRRLFLNIPHFLRMLLFRLFCKPFPERMREIGGTCAFTSVGKHGVDFTTPLSPKSITFSLGRVCERPMAVDGVLKPRISAYVTLTYDHRVADGAECAALGARVKDIIENSDWISIAREGRP